jgi:hypothetical protein
MSGMLLGPADGHLERVQERYPSAFSREQSDGSHLITIPSFPLAVGWNQNDTTVCFVAPISYPVAAPDCFYADRTLTLADGSLPKNARLVTLPTASELWLWFSYHVTGWSAARDSYLTYVRVIERRLSEPC